VDRNKGKQIIRNLMIGIIDNNNPGNFNQAVMELGALICKPKNPNCSQCPLQEKCLALANDTILERPIKSKRINIKHRYLNYFLFSDRNGLLLQKRTNNDIWKNLYQLPLIEEENITNELEKKWGLKNESINFEKEIIHKLTHQILHIRFYILAIPKDYSNISVQYYTINEALKKSIPTPIDNFLREVRIF
jgi:A/G-specific adenine glycosylase